MKIEKAIEISEAKIHFVSLVDKAANKRQFLITKAADGQAHFSTLGKILKVDESTHYATGIVYEPLVEDAHGNFMTAGEIQKAAYWFAKNGDEVDLQHSFEAVDGVTVVETYIAPCDMEINGQAVVKGTWIMTAEVQNDAVWEKVQKGEVTGFSMGGVGQYSETETDLTESVEKRGVFKKLAGLFGFDIVEKGEMKDAYEKSAKVSNFWNAFYALEDILRKYNWQTDHYEFISDEAIIREVLTEFSAIVTEILAAPNIVKALGPEPVEKAGQKKNKQEEIELNKTEIQTLVEESIKKALEGTAPTPETTPETETPLTKETVQKMVADAIQKALAPTDEPLTVEAVAKMVEVAVAKAVEPVLKARGLSSNLNDEKTVEKSDQHFLAGII